MYYPVFNIFSILFMVAAAVGVLIKDRRLPDRIIVICSLIAQIGNLALHHIIDAGNVAIPVMLIEGALLYCVLTSGHDRRNTFALLVFSSITLTFLWLIDSVAGTGLLYVGNEPSVYTTVSAILTILQGAFFFSMVNGKRGDNNRNNHLRGHRRYDGKGDQ